MGAGWYAKTAIVCATGACLGDGSRDILAEEVRENFSKITDLAGAKPLHDSLEIFELMGPLIK
jgi:hypothetical protein